MGGGVLRPVARRALHYSRAELLVTALYSDGSPTLPSPMGLSRPISIPVIIRMRVQMYARNYHSYTHLTPSLGIV